MTKKTEEPQKTKEGFDLQQEALLKKRKQDDISKKRRFDARAKQKMAQVRQKKIDDKLKIAGGQKTILPEVFVSNYMKQQRNYVKYRRNKNAGNPRGASELSEDKQIMLPKDQRVPQDCLLLVVRIKESRATTPQAQKILKELGLKEINNCSFVKANSDNLQKLLIIRDYVAWGQPTKRVVDDIIRKRGYLKSQDLKRIPISDNVVVEELLSEKGIICIEDIIDALWRCKHN